MKRAGTMRRDLLLLAAVALLALCALAVQRTLARPAAFARVTVDGVEAARLALSEPQIRTVETERGINVIEVSDGSIRVREADCPDLRCVRQGPISRTGEVIACVPHGLLITLEGGQGGVDAVTQ